MSSRVGETVSAGEQGAKLQDFVAYSPSGAAVEASGSAQRFKVESFIEFGAGTVPSARYARLTSLIIPYMHLFDPIRGERFHSARGRLTGACSRLSSRSRSTGESVLPTTQGRKAKSLSPL